MTQEKRNAGELTKLLPELTKFRVELISRKIRLSRFIKYLTLNKQMPLLGLYKQTPINGILFLLLTNKQLLASYFGRFGSTNPACRQTTRHDLSVGKLTFIACFYF
jgi:hypothetical protein